MNKILRNNIESIRLNPSNQRSFVFYFLILILSLSLNFCSSGMASKYESDYTFTNEISKAKSLQLSAKVPKGWFAAEDNENNLIDLWLIKDDYSATLNFVQLNLDSATVKEIGNDEINGLINLSKSFRIAKYGKAFQKFFNQEVFEINNKQFGAYEYIDGSKRTIRVAVFKTGKKYYELSAIPVKTENLPELYQIQNSVLSSVD
ncbi:MAG: hypothetical protein CVV24_08140 [Ignavibacteriae bacterium HGW-Ignavibacteriae-3]|nr:MAG: hypothetical protein CVV24_08140 [Ignavibacteriae bacterium HGW-Ignavibacteriae-3]